MPDLYGLVAKNDSWTVPGDPHDVRERLAREITNRGGKLVSKDDSSFEFTHGSRSAYRLIGIIAPAALAPVRATIRVEKARNKNTSSDVYVEAASDPGYYAWPARSVFNWTYDRAFKYLFRILRESYVEKSG